MPSKAVYALVVIIMAVALIQIAYLGYVFISIGDWDTGMIYVLLCIILLIAMIGFGYARLVRKQQSEEEVDDIAEM